MKAHPIDWLSLTVGLVALAAGIAAVVVTELRWLPDVRWMIPITLAVAGVIIVAAALVSLRKPSGSESTDV